MNVSFPHQKNALHAVEHVNFEEMNEVPSLAGLTLCHGAILPEMDNSWYEYVPAGFGEKGPVPLVVQLHGGGQDGLRWARITLWHVLAEQHGFIVIYPNSPEYGTWRCGERDIRYLHGLIDHICCKYPVDRSRIFMQGMSNGDMMTLAYSMAHPETLAAAAFMTGPVPASMLGDDRPMGPLPILQMRGELDVNWGLTPETRDVYANRYQMNDLNRELWMDVNGARTVFPCISIQGRDNFVCFQGSQAPIISWEVQGMGHREPVYSAPILWDHFYSGYRREEGRICTAAPNSPLRADPDLTFLALGARRAYQGGACVEISASAQGIVRLLIPQQTAHFCPVYLGEMCETSVLSAPLSCLSSLWGASIEEDPSGENARVRLADGRLLTLHARSLLYELDGNYHAFQKPCLVLGGQLYVPVAELCEEVLGLSVCQADDVLCISRHHACLGRYTASIVRSLLGGEMRPRQRPAALE